MNSRQRRGIVLLLLSVLCAFGAFAGVLSVISDVQSKVGPEVSAYELRTDVAAYKVLSEGQFRKVQVPERWLPSTAVRDLDQVVGRIAVNPLRKGSLLQTDMVADRPALKPGQQEIAIMIDAATGVAGKITPGSSVNIYATFAGEDGGANSSKVIVSNAKVIDVGRLTALKPRPGETADAGGEAVPITFALRTLDAQRVAYAESFATHVRLALVAPGSDATIPDDQRDYTLAGDK
ncbi:Flp pilus assembly protein CpaB [Streptomyces purpurogeneiscleroticus]|uniref:Flp pilus assembly protein CpaB n=1 Tax=Streptomyces purpurogeneiscleroticus TaxID=68259 RepID=UPI001CBBB8D6|nr:Flp pilus assembly protein CpaB [Streptomyces purpurogeneiscleroticus]MBZ4020716.1 Flp pilus assembly protein CpaB [Streptomyces purpurogeneiscleroticus]